MEGLTEIVSNVWDQGFLGVGVTEIIVSLLIFIAGAISRAFLVGSVLKKLEKLTADTESEIDDVLLESLKKPLGYIPITVAIYFIAIYLPLSGMAELFATNLIKAMIAFTIFSALANSVAPIFQAFTTSTVLTESMTKWLERAIEAGDNKTGSCIMLMEKGMDTGPILSSKSINIHSSDTSKTIHDKLSNLTAEMLVKTIKGYIDGIMYYNYEKPAQSGYNSWPYDNPFFLIINLAIGGEWGGQQGIDNSIFPATFMIDYVRMFKKVKNNTQYTYWICWWI